MHHLPLLFSSEPDLFIQYSPSIFLHLYNSRPTAHCCMALSVDWIHCTLGFLYEILSLHCSLLNLQKSLRALKPYTATESYLLCVSGVSCHGEKIPFEVWPPSFTLTIMLLALSCPPCKSPCLLFCPAPSPPLLHTPWLFSFVSLSVKFLPVQCEEKWSKPYPCKACWEL